MKPKKHKRLDCLVQSPRNDEKKVAFTLAEVLITLGIIGVVAAMTLPNLIANHQKKVTITKLKAAYQMFSEVIQKAQYDNGGTIELSDESNVIVELEGNVPEISQLYIDPYIKGVKKYNSNRSFHVQCKSGKRAYIVRYANDHRAPMCIPNGMCYWVGNHGGNYRYLTVDLNGPKKPNIAGRDVFVFNITGGKWVSGYGTREISLPYPMNMTEQQINDKCNNTSTNDSWNGVSCFTKIVNDGWEIKDDYPW